jgi:hypothetical protein
VADDVQPALPESEVREALKTVKPKRLTKQLQHQPRGSGGKLRDRDVSPYNTWKPEDTGRWWRNKDTAGQQKPDSGLPQIGKPERVKPLVGLQIETNGQYGLDESSNPNQLWVCRICRTDLTDGQLAYCSKDCANVMEAARARAGRSEPWTTRTTGHGGLSMGGFSLDSITIAGLGKLEIPPVVWNGIDKSEPVYRAGKPQPWFLPSRCKELTPAEIAAGWSGPASDARSVFGLLLTPGMVTDFVWRRDSGEDTRTPGEWADRLARRYGTGGAPVRRCGRFGCNGIPGKTANGKRQKQFCSYACQEQASLSSWESVTPPGVHRMVAGRADKLPSWVRQWSEKDGRLSRVFQVNRAGNVWTAGPDVSGAYVTGMTQAV